MTQDLVHEVRVVAGGPDGVERRRPGRVAVSPELVGLLRRPAAEVVDSGAVDWSTLADQDGMAPARAIGIGLLLAVPLWAMLGALGYAMLG